MHTFDDSRGSYITSCIVDQHHTFNVFSPTGCFYRTDIVPLSLLLFPFLHSRWTLLLVFDPSLEWTQSASNLLSCHSKPSIDQPALSLHHTRRSIVCFLQCIHVRSRASLRENLKTRYRQRDI